MKFIRIAQAAIVAVFIASTAQAFDGLSIGVGIHKDQLTTETGKGNIVANPDVFSLHARYLWKAEGSNWHSGIEFTYTGFEGGIPGIRTLKSETFIHGLDISGVVGYQVADRWLPHAFVGASFVQSSMHGSDGYHYGAGVSYKVSERFIVTGRWTWREFDGPAQGSDLVHSGFSILGSYRF